MSLPTPPSFSNGVQDGRLSAIEETCRLTRGQIHSDFTGLHVKLDRISEQVWMLKGKAAAWGAFGGLLGAGVVAVLVHFIGG